MNILAIIPARGGSKEIPQKNIKKLCGKPLIEYTINAAQRSKKINKIIVSTDNKKIAKISKYLGVEMPFLRPKKISADNSPTIDLIRHTIKELKKNEFVPDIITILQPTSPFRTSQMIDKSINLLKKTDATSVISVTKINKHPFLWFEIQGEYLKSVKKDVHKFYQRQLFPNIFYPTGAIYTFWTSTLTKYDSIYGSKIKPMIIKDEMQNLDIDNDFDFFVAKMGMKYCKKEQHVTSKKMK